MDSGQTSSPLPSFKSLRCLRCGVKDLLEHGSDFFGLSSDEVDISMRGYHKAGEGKKKKENDGEGLYGRRVRESE